MLASGWYEYQNTKTMQCISVNQWCEYEYEYSSGTRMYYGVYSDTKEISRISIRM